MRVPERLGETCTADGCTATAEIAGWCPAHAIARYRQHAVRPTPERWSKYHGRPKCSHDGCRMYALTGQTGCRYHSN